MPKKNKKKSKTYVEDKLSDEILQSSSIHWNVKSEFVMITEDKLELCLKKYNDSLKKSNDWITPLSIFITLLLAILTADFKDFIFSGTMWKAIFIVSMVISIYKIILAVKNHINKMDIEEVIAEIKKDRPKIFNMENIIFTTPKIDQVDDSKIISRRFNSKD